MTVSVALNGIHNNGNKLKKFNIILKFEFIIAELRSFNVVRNVIKVIYLL